MSWGKRFKKLLKKEEKDKISPTLDSPRPSFHGVDGTLRGSMDLENLKELLTESKEPQNHSSNKVTGSDPQNPAKALEILENIKASMAKQRTRSPIPPSATDSIEAPPSPDDHREKHSPQTMVMPDSMKQAPPTPPKTVDMPEGLKPTSAQKPLPHPVTLTMPEGLKPKTQHPMANSPKPASVTLSMPEGLKPKPAQPVATTPVTMAVPERFKPKTSPQAASSPVTITMPEGLKPKPEQSGPTSPVTVSMPDGLKPKPVQISPTKPVCIPMSNTGPETSPIQKSTIPNIEPPLPLEEISPSRTNASVSAPVEISENSSPPSPPPAAIPTAPPARPPSAAAVQFSAELFEEHFEELVFYFSQICADPTQPEYEWAIVEHAESALEKEVAAIDTYGEHARAALVPHLKSDEPEWVGAAVYALLNLAPTTSTQTIISCFSSQDDDDILNAMATAMMRVQHTPVEALASLLCTSTPKIVHSAASILLYHPERGGNDVVDALLFSSDPWLAEAMLQTTSLPTSFRQAVETWTTTHYDENLESALLKSRLLQGESDALRIAQSRLAEKPHPKLFPLLGFAGSKYAFEKVDISAIEDELDLAAAALAIGQLGNPAEIDRLFSLLDHQESNVQEAAATALEQITGAGLTDEVNVESDADDPFNIDMGNEDDDEDETVERPPLCISKDYWQQFWQTHREEFVIDQCYRHGKLFNFGQCIDTLADEFATPAERMADFLSLRIRAAVPVSFDLRWPVKTQRQSISKLQDWWTQNHQRFKPGQWYFFGEWLR